MSGFDNEVLYADNVDFSGGFPVSGKVTSDGQLLIGSSVAPNIRVAELTEGPGISITNGNGSITIGLDGGGDAIQTLTGNSGGAIFPTSYDIDVVTNGTNVLFKGTQSPGKLTLDFDELNIMIGQTPLFPLSGVDNVFLGYTAGGIFVSGSSNTVVGSQAFLASTNTNKAVAIGALSQFNYFGNGDSNNVSVGYNSLFDLETGTNNIAIGSNAGTSYASNESANILIGHTGVVGDFNVTRIGSSQLECYIDGIDGVDVGSTATVVTEASDQLGTAVITGGSNITVTPGANLITIGVTSGSFVESISAGPGVTITGTAAVPIINSIVYTSTAATNLAINSGYFATAAGTYNMPNTSASGSLIEIVCDVAGVIVDPFGTTQIRFGNSITTVSTGTLTSTAAGDSLIMRYRNSNTTWYVMAAVGNWTVT